MTVSDLFRESREDINRQACSWQTLSVIWSRIAESQDGQVDFLCNRAQFFSDTMLWSLDARLLKVPERFYLII